MSTTITEISGADLERKAAEALAWAIDSKNIHAIDTFAHAWSTIVTTNMNTTAFEQR